MCNSKTIINIATSKHLKTNKMKTSRLKNLNRKQLEKLLKINHPEKGFNKRTTVHNLRMKFNLLGDEFGSITFNDKFQIINPF